MKKALFVLSLAVLTLSALPAQAGPKFMGIFWWSSHWKNQDFVPYFENGTDPHNTQWAAMDKDWKPQDWIGMNGSSGAALVDRWHVSKIIRGQSVEGDTPVLEVGPNFYHLSGRDQRRVAATVDHVYQVTAEKPGMFYLKDWATEKYIGYYTASGLVLQ
jgi:hypothetical protein